MVFKSDRQRKAVMARLNQGSLKSDVSPQIIREADVLKPGLARKAFIKDRKSGLTISQSLKKLTDKAIREGKIERERKTTKLVKKLIKKNPKLKTLFIQRGFLFASPSARIKVIGKKGRLIEIEITKGNLEKTGLTRGDRLLVRRNEISIE